MASIEKSEAAAPPPAVRAAIDVLTWFVTAGRPPVFSSEVAGAHLATLRRKRGDDSVLLAKTLHAINAHVPIPQSFGDLENAGITAAQISMASNARRVLWEHEGMG